jgi:septum formation protein
MKVSPSLCPLILASASPRRRKILKRLGLEFKVQPSDLEEDFQQDQSPEENAERLARNKALRVSDRVDKGTVIGCDTLVAVGKILIGKPASAKEAKEVLAFLSGKTQRVISGLCLIHVTTGKTWLGHDTTWVYTRPMSGQEIDAYVGTGECFGKAGAYAIQETGDRFIQRLEGSFDNVVGFPTELFEQSVRDLSLLLEGETRQGSGGR